MQTNSFFHPNVTKVYLKTNYYRYSRGWSDENCEAYILTLPLYKYQSMSLLELRIVLYNDGTTRIDVLDKTTHGIYAPWYRHEDYSKYPILKEIDQNIIKLMTSLGFKEKENNNDRFRCTGNQNDPRTAGRTHKTSQRYDSH